MILWITCVYLSGEDPRFYKRGIGQYPARLSGGFQSPTEINASGGLQPRKVEGASHHARRGKNAEAFLKLHRAILLVLIMRNACKVKAEKMLITKNLRQQ